jgi:hypothetical protein
LEALEQERRKMRAPVLTLLAIAIGALGCATEGHTPEALRYRCLQKAHQVLRGSGLGDQAYETMMREVYARCLDSQSISDAAPGS